MYTIRVHNSTKNGVCQEYRGKYRANAVIFVNIFDRAYLSEHLLEKNQPEGDSG